jgi:hypothetical protein
MRCGRVILNAAIFERKQHVFRRTHGAFTDLPADPDTACILVNLYKGCSTRGHRALDINGDAGHELECVLIDVSRVMKVSEKRVFASLAYV